MFIIDCVIAALIIVSFFKERAEIQNGLLAAVESGVADLKTSAFLKLYTDPNWGKTVFGCVFIALLGWLISAPLIAASMVAVVIYNVNIANKFASAIPTSKTTAEQPPVEDVTDSDAATA